MTKEKNTQLLTMAGFACLSLGLAPFFPEPHIWGKLRWVLGGGEGMSSLDYFDLLFHGAPWMLFIGLLLYRLRGKA